MRFRMLERQERKAPLSGQAGGYSDADRCAGMWKPVGGVREAESHEEALRQQRPTTNGRWLVLAEDDQTWRIFDVVVRQVLDVKSVQDAPGFSSALVAS